MNERRTKPLILGIIVAVLATALTGITQSAIPASAAGTTRVMSEANVAKLAIFDNVDSETRASSAIPNPLGTILPYTEVEISSGDTIMDVIKRGLEKAEIEYTVSAYGYLSAIKNFKDSEGKTIAELGEGTIGATGGWFVAVNDWFIDSSADTFSAEKDDIIELMYSLDYGEDCGGSFVNDEQSLKSATFSRGILSSAFDRLKYEYELTVPAGTTALHARALASNRNNKAEISVNGTLYKPLTFFPVTNGTVIKIKTTRNLYDPLTYQAIGSESSEYSFTVKYGADINNVYAALSEYYKKIEPPQNTAEIGNVYDWSYIANKAMNTEALSFYPEVIVDYITSAWQKDIGFTMSTELSRLIISLSAAGIDPQYINGNNLVETLANHPNVISQGPNAISFALLAYNSCSYDVSSQSPNSKEALIDALLEKQLTGSGGFALTGEDPDPDVTAIAIQALSQYTEGNTKAASALEKALSCIANIQNDDGGFSSVYGKTCESSAQVIIALTLADIDISNDLRFIKNGNTVIDSLLMYYLPENTGEFSHTLNLTADGIATDQAALAMAALSLQNSGGKKLYKYNENDISITTEAFVDYKSVKISNYRGKIKLTSKTVVYKKSSLKDKKAGVLKKGKKANVLSINGKYAKVKINGKTGFINADKLNFTKGQAGTTKSKAPIYKSNSKKSDILIRIAKKSSLDILSKKGKFYKIRITV